MAFVRKCLQKMFKKPDLCAICICYISIKIFNFFFVSSFVLFFFLWVLCSIGIVVYGGPFLSYSIPVSELIG